MEDEDTELEREWTGRKSSGMCVGIICILTAVMLVGVDEELLDYGQTTVGLRARASHGPAGERTKIVNGSSVKESWERKAVKLEGKLKTRGEKD